MLFTSAHRTFVEWMRNCADLVSATNQMNSLAFIYLFISGKLNSVEPEYFRSNESTYLEATNCVRIKLIFYSQKKTANSAYELMTHLTCLTYLTCVSIVFACFILTWKPRIENVIWNGVLRANYYPKFMGRKTSNGFCSVSLLLMTAIKKTKCHQTNSL